MKARKFLILAAVALLFFAGITGVFSPKGHVPSGQQPFVDINAQKMDDLRQAFNAADKDVRIVLWVAPT